MITTTLNKIKEKHPCADGWKKLLTNLGKKTADDEPLPLLAILESNGLDDALWCLRCTTEHDKEWRLFAVWCARKVEHLMKDERSIAAINVAEKYANGQASSKELSTARAAACDAAQDAAWDAARAAAWDAARGAAKAAAWDAARAAAWGAAKAAAWDAARDAARGAAWDAARAAAWAEQKSEFIRIISGE